MARSSLRCCTTLSIRCSPGRAHKTGHLRKTWGGTTAICLLRVKIKPNRSNPLCKVLPTAPQPEPGFSREIKKLSFSVVINQFIFGAAKYVVQGQRGRMLSCPWKHIVQGTSFKLAPQNTDGGPGRGSLGSPCSFRSAARINPYTVNLLFEICQYYVNNKFIMWFKPSLFFSFWEAASCLLPFFFRDQGRNQG